MTQHHKHTFCPAALKLHNCAGSAVVCCIAPHEEIEVRLSAAEGNAGRRPCAVVCAIADNCCVLQEGHMDHHCVDALQVQCARHIFGSVSTSTMSISLP